MELFEMIDYEMVWYAIYLPRSSGKNYMTPIELI